MEIETTYLRYTEINLGEGETVDLEQNVVRASEERSAAFAPSQTRARAAYGARYRGARRVLARHRGLKDLI